MITMIDLPPILVPRTQAIEDSSLLIDIQQHQPDITAPENTSATQTHPPPNTLLATSLYTPMDSPTTSPGYMSEDGDNTDNLSRFSFFVTISFRTRFNNFALHRP